MNKKEEKKREENNGNTTNVSQGSTVGTGWRLHSNRASVWRKAGIHRRLNITWSYGGMASPLPPSQGRQCRGID